MKDRSVINKFTSNIKRIVKRIEQEKLVGSQPRHKKKHIFANL